MAYTSFFGLCTALKEYIDDISYTNPPSRCTIPFPTLPLELREIIYRLAIPPFPSHHLNISAADATYGISPRYPHWLPALCHANEATRIDVSLYLLRVTEFSLLYPAQVACFTHFLDTLPHKTGFSALRRLDFQLFSRHQTDVGQGNVYIDFMKLCPRLTQVCIKFEVGYLTRDDLARNSENELPSTFWAFSGTRILELEQLVDAYQLGGLLELESLIKITVEVWPRIRVGDRWGMEGVLMDCKPLIERLAEWLRSGFEQKGRNVDVYVVEADTPGLRWHKERGFKCIRRCELA
jgi:hypothetical protein